MAHGILAVSTSAKMTMIDITDDVEDILRSEALLGGIIYLFNPHTTAGLTINEGADPDVCRDIIMGLRHIVPERLDYRHLEGNSPAHLMTLLTGSSLTLQVEEGRLQLGTWQKIFFCEYDGPRQRKLRWKFIEDTR
ncbi:MAG: secondary thiamine-phosphate synthase enzyme YjbQ [Desulforhopalus sp.]